MLHDDNDIDWGCSVAKPSCGDVPTAPKELVPVMDPELEADEAEIRRGIVFLPDDDLSSGPPLKLQLRGPPSKGQRRYQAVESETTDASLDDGTVDDNDDSVCRGAFVDTGKEFLATKSFLGAIYPPSVYIRPGKDVFDNMDETFNNWSQPKIDLELDYVMGYRARDSRYNLHWIDDERVVFPVAAVCVIYHMGKRDEDFFFAHEDDIVSLDLHHAIPSKEGDVDLVASGSIGAQTQCQLCIWEAKTMTLRHDIRGFLQFGVTSVGFNPDASLVCAVGLDEHHSVAVFSVTTGLLMAHCAADKNRLLHARFNLSGTVNSNECFVTVGVSHICFWGPLGTAGKTGNYFLSTEEPLDRRLAWNRGFGIEDIDKIALMAVDFTYAHTIVGGTDGIVYLFDSVKHAVVNRVAIGEGPEKIYQILTLRGPEDDRTVNDSTVVIGTKQGIISIWSVTTSSDALSVDMQENRSFTADKSRMDLNLCEDATDNDKDFMVNSVRSISWWEATGELAIGTILSSVYTVKLQKWNSSEMKAQARNPPWFKRLISGHWGNLKDDNAYGEVWGVDVHPTEQLIVTCGDDSTVRLWNLDTAVEVGRKFVHYMAYKCSFHPSAEIIAVGHRNGGVSIVKADLSCILIHCTRHKRRRCVADIGFSPNGKYLAVAWGISIDILQVCCDKDPVTGIDTYTLEEVGSCHGHTSFVDSMDWNLESHIIQSVSRGYDLLYFSIPDCVMVTGVKALADQLWFTQTCCIGWGVQGIWARYADGTDINSCAKSRSQRWLITTDDWGRVKLFEYPCLGSGFDRKTGRLNVRPEYREYRGHSSHVTNCTWTCDDTYVATTGGADLSLFIWKVKYNDVPRPEFFLNTRSVGQVKHGRRGLKDAGVDASRVSTATVARVADECFMCKFKFPDVNATSCPRCFAPRTEPPKATLRKAWSGQADARFMQPTQSFAQYTRTQQQQRKQTDERVKPEVVWKNGNVKVVETVRTASDDEEEIAKKLKGVRKTIVTTTTTVDDSNSSAVDRPPAKAPKAKSTAGPMYRDY